MTITDYDAPVSFDHEPICLKCDSAMSYVSFEDGADFNGWFCKNPNCDFEIETLPIAVE